MNLETVLIGLCLAGASAAFFGIGVAIAFIHSRHKEKNTDC